MNSDKELLTLAAKAAGYDKGLGLFWDDNFQCLVGGGRFTFDPLNDDGDALRLAVILSIDLEFFGGFEEIRAGTVDFVCDEPYGYKNFDKNFEATRRAIVIAAATIGQEKMGDFVNRLLEEE